MLTVGGLSGFDARYSQLGGDTNAHQGSQVIKRVEEILKEKGVDKPDIHRFYLLKLGGVLILTPDHKASVLQDSHRDSSKPSKEPPSDLHHQIMQVLKKHPNVFETTTLRTTPHGALLARPTPMGLLLHSDTVKLHINLPAAVQKYSAEPWGRQPIESFDVATTGSIFAAYAPIEDWPYPAYIAHEFQSS